MPSFVRDLQTGFRRFQRQPFVTAVAVLSLALGLTAAAGLTSLLDAFGFRPLAVADPDALVTVQMPAREGGRGPISWDDLIDVQAIDSAFESVAASMTKGAALTAPDRSPDIVWLGIVTSNYFSVLGVQAVAGREFISTDGAPGAPPVAFLSHRIWARQFGASPDAVGQTIEINGTACTIIGVAPRAFSGLDLFSAIDVWVPPSTWSQASSPDRGRPPVVDSRDRVWSVVARLRRNVTIEQATAAVQPLLPGMLQRLPAGTPAPTLTVVDFQDARLGGLTVVRTIAWMLVGLVILIGCANVSGLLLGQAEARRREIAIRTALGAGRRRIVRMLVTESLALAMLAAAASLALSWWTIRALPALIPPSPLPFGLEFHFDLRVLLVTIGLALSTVLVFGLWPSLRLARRDFTPSLAQTGPLPAFGVRGLSARNVLVVAQVAVSSALLITGGLLVRGLDRSQHVPPGFERRPMLLTTIVPGITGSSAAHTRGFLGELQDRLRVAPGVASVAFARTVPLSLMGGGGTRDIEVAGRTDTTATPLKLRYNAVSDGYFETMGTRLVRGRPIAREDGASAPRVAVINQIFARQYWPGESAVGHVLRVRGMGDVTIIGVAEDGKYNRLSEAPQPYVFFAADQLTFGEVTLIVRAAGDDAAALASTVRSVLHDLDPRMPALQMVTLDEHLRLSTFDLQIAQVVVAALGGSGLLLSVAGLYGVITFMVARRLRELGIRLALGASSTHVWQSVIGRAIALAVCGLALGLPAALLAARSFVSSLYGLSPMDPVTYGAVSALVLGVTIAAAWFPARRAMQTNPAVVFRAE